MSVAINETNFPNRDFRNYVSQYWDLDGDGTLSDEEIAAVTSFYCRPDQYHSWSFDVKGLEFFTNLESIDTSGPDYSDVNFSAFTKLKSITMQYSRSSLSDVFDFRGCSSLTSVDLSLGSINRIYFGASIITASISQYTAKTVNPTAIFDFTDSVSIQKVTFAGLGTINDPYGETNEVSIIGLSNKSSLATVTLRQCKCFLSLDCSNSTNLTNLSCTDCDSLRTLNISGCTSLESLICSNCDLRPSLDLRSMTALRTIDVSRSNLSSLLLGEKPNLSVLRCCTSEDKICIRELDLNGCPLIKHKMFMGKTYTFNYYGDHSITFMGYDKYGEVAKDPSQNKIAYDSRTTVLPISIAAVEGEDIPFELEDIWGNLKAYDADTHARVYSFSADYSENGKKYYFLDKDPEDDTRQARSFVFELIIFQRPIISAQPKSVSVVNGFNAAFSIIAMDPNGGELAYQWERSTDNGESWSALDNNANSSTYTIKVSNSFDGYKYRCVVASPFASITSDAATISIVIASFQWQVSSDNGTTWADISQNGDNSSYSVVAAKTDSGKQYRCIATNAAGSDTSDPAILRVLDPPAITSRSTIAECIAENTEVFLSVSVSGDDLHYQWQESANLGAWVPINGATSPEYSFIASRSDTGKRYRCYIYNDVGNVFCDIYDSPTNTENGPTSITVVYIPVVHAEESSSVVKTGNRASFSISAEGGRLSYKWQQKSSIGTTWSDIPNATTSEYSFITKKSDSGKQYRCEVTNIAGTVYSTEVTLTVLNPPAITATLDDKEVGVGANASFASSASGDDLHYQWQISDDNNSWTDVTANGSSPTYSFVAEESQNRKYFRYRVYNDVGEELSNAAQLFVITSPSITSQPESQVIAAGQTISLIISASGEGLSYKWQVSVVNGTTWSDIPNTTTPEYSFVAKKSDSGKQYRCKVTNIAGTVYSTEVTLTVLNPPAINSEFIIQDVVDDETVLLQSDASGDELEYKWQTSSNGDDWTDITEAGNATSYSFTADISQNHKYYRYQISNRVGEETSNAAQLFVITPPNITSQPESQVVITQTQASFSVSIEGEHASYKWQVSVDDGSSWADIPNATTPEHSFTATKSDSGKQYRCEVTNIAGTVLSNSVSLKVLFEPVIVINPSFPNRVTDGDYVYCDADAHGDELQHQWYVKYAGIDQWYPIDTESSDIYTDNVTYEHEPHQENGEWVSGARFVRLAFYVTKEFTGNKYYCEFWNDVGRVSTPETNELYVLFGPRIVSVSSPESAIRSGDPVSLSVVAEGGDLKYQWQVSTNSGSSWKNISTNGKKSTYSFTATSSQNGYQLRCKVTNAVGSVLCEPIRLKVLIPPSVSEGPASQSVGIDTTATFTAVINGTDLTYQWQVSSDNGVAWIDIGDTNAPSYSLTAGIEKDGHMYRCQASNELGFVTTGSALLTVLTFPAIITQPSSATVEYASNVVFLVSATGGELAYQWEYSSDNGVTWTTITKNGTNSTYSFLAVDSQNGFLYHCIVGNKLGTVVSESVSLTVLGSATTEEEIPVLVFAGKYLPSQMAAMIRSLPIGTNLDEIAFGARTVETLHASIGRFGSTDPRYYEEIAESINELKRLIVQLQSQNPSS